jgi:serine protease Do
VVSGFLGVEVESVNSDLAAQANLDVTHGAYVADVTPSSPADKAGVRVGDVVVKFDTTAINTAEALTTAVKGDKPGTKVDIVVNRAGKQLTFHATLATRPSS